MISAEGRSESGVSGRLVWLYALAWVPYLLAYGAVLRASMGVPLSWATVGALANGLPPALLGWWALEIGRFAPRLESRSRFRLLHAVSAVTYAVACMVGTWLLFQTFHRIETGSWDWSRGESGPLVWQLLICTLIYAVLAGVGHALTLRDRLQEEETRSARARELAARSQLEALRSRLDPHFLFNTLHSLLALVRRDPSAAEEGLERLGDLLHYALRAREADGDEVTLAEERGFLVGYIELERLRLADRLRWEEHFEPAALSCRVPAFTLQPLVENALRHAVAARRGGGRVAVGGRVDDHVLRLEVADDGPGADPEALDGRGQGLELVGERLRAIHGELAELEIETAPGAGFKVRIHLPVVRDTRESAP